MNPFQQYLDLGWKLCKIEPGTKGPNHAGWNKIENALTSLDGVQGAGLMHAYSGTCAIDIDDWAEAEKYLQAHGIDLTALLMAPDAVTISSGTEGRAKLLYKLDEPLTTIKLGENKKLEFRCRTAAGTSVQDVLPPSVHPSGRRYTMTGDPAKLPAIPERLLALWQKQLGEESKPTVDKSPEYSNSVILARMKKVIDKLDPDMPHDDWLQIGMALHYESAGSEAGFKIWNEWSSLSKDKYPGTEILWSRWTSFGASARPITGDFLLHQEVATDEEFSVIEPGADFMADPKKPNRFIGQFLRPDQFGTIPKPKWIIPGILPENGVGSLWGPSGCGKSFLGIDIAFAISTGRSWRGRAIKQGAVAYVAAEDAAGCRERVLAGLAAKGCSTAQIYVIDAGPKLHEKADMVDMIEAIKAIGNISLIVVDTLATATPGMDENSAKEVGIFLEKCRQLQKQIGAAVLLIHHSGKDASRGARGSSAFHGNFDMEWEIDRNEHLRKTTLKKIRNASEYDKKGRRIEFSFVLNETDETCSVEWIHESD